MTDYSQEQPFQFEQNARKLEELVARERQRRSRLLRFYLGLLLVPVVIGGVAIARGRYLSSETVATQIAPLVDQKVEAQLGPVVEQKFGDRIQAEVAKETTIQVERVGFPKLNSLAVQVERTEADLSQIRASVNELDGIKKELPAMREQLSVQGNAVRDIEGIKKELPSIREQLSVQGNAVRNLQQRFERLTPGGTAEGGRPDADIATLRKSIEGLNQVLARLQRQVEENSRQIKILAAGGGRAPR